MNVCVKQEEPAGIITTALMVAAPIWTELTMSRSDTKTYDRRLDALKGRRDWLDKKIVDREGANNSYLLAEVSAIDWAIAVIEANQDYAMELIAQKRREKEES